MLCFSGNILLQDFAINFSLVSAGAENKVTKIEGQYLAQDNQTSEISMSVPVDPQSEISCTESRGGRPRAHYKVTKLNAQAKWVPMLSDGQQAAFTINKVEFGEDGRIQQGSGKIISQNVACSFRTILNEDED